MFQLYLILFSSFINVHNRINNNTQGQIVENLMKLLTKMTLKFLSWNMANALIFIAEKCEQLTFFAAKNINVFEDTLATTINKFVINELVKANDALNNWAQI